MTEQEIIEDLRQEYKSRIEDEGEFDPALFFIIRQRGIVMPVFLPEFADRMFNMSNKGCQKLISIAWDVLKLVSDTELLSVVLLSDTYVSVYEATTEATAEVIHESVESGVLPKPSNDPRRQEAFMIIESRATGDTIRVELHTKNENGKVAFQPLQSDKSVLLPYAALSGRFSNLYPR